MSQKVIAVKQNESVMIFDNNTLVWTLEAGGTGWTQISSGTKVPGGQIVAIAVQGSLPSIVLQAIDHVEFITRTDPWPVPPPPAPQATSLVDVRQQLSLLWKT